MTEFRIESLARTHEGRVRTNNEDSFCERPEALFWAVADGMGGHEHGEWASAALSEALGAAEIASEFGAACHSISDAIHAANTAIWEEGERRGTQMGSTVVTLHISGRQFAVLWVGDSRAYLVRGGAIHRLSRDHTQVQEMVDRGMLSEAEAEAHPMAHVLARAVGVQPQVSVEGVADEVQPGDIFLLCSDGLTGRVADSEVRDILLGNGEGPPIDQLIALVLERGAPDNVTIIVVSVDETTMLSLATPTGIELS